MPERCPLTELLVDECAHCRNIPDPEGEDRRRNEQLLSAPGWHAAQWPGTCERCGERFAAGTPITMDVLGPKPGWRAACCANEDLPTPDQHPRSRLAGPSEAESK